MTIDIQLYTKKIPLKGGLETDFLTALIKKSLWAVCFEYNILYVYMRIHILSYIILLMAAWLNE